MDSNTETPLIVMSGENNEIISADGSNNSMINSTADGGTAAVATTNDDDVLKTQFIKKYDKTINYIKLNVYDIGCYFQLAQLLLVAKKSGRGVMMSTVNEFFPETTDTFVSDFAVGLGVDYVEFGGLLSSEYNSKYTRLISIQKEMKNY
jgi:enolase